LLAGILALRDPLSTPGNLALITNPHGSGLDRVGALQVGFEQGTDSCAQIDAAEISKRRGDLPRALFDPRSENSDINVEERTLSSLTELLQQIFHPSQPPSVTTGSATCGGGPPTKFAAYCPSSNTVMVDLPALQQIATPADERNQQVLLQGDNTALSIVTSRYVMALQHERGLELNSPAAAMRTACLTGVAQRQMAQPIAVTSGQGLTLGAGDLDEAIAGLLTNGVVASDVTGTTLPSGFTRVSAFRSGLLSDADDCYRRF
jgi:predicted metalloprotease